VTLTPRSFPGLRGAPQSTLDTHLDRSTGQTLVVVPHEKVGDYTIVADRVTCRPAMSCASGQIEQWSMTLDVV
jgi:hypothetical protein